MLLSAVDFGQSPQNVFTISWPVYKSEGSGFLTQLTLSQSSRVEFLPPSGSQAQVHDSVPIRTYVLYWQTWNYN